MYESGRITHRAGPGDPVVWRLNPSRASAWRAWDGVVVVYDDLSGDTLKLDAVASEIFRRLQQRPGTKEELVEHLAAALQLPEADLRLVRLIELALERLHHCNLLSTVRTGS